MRRRIYTVMVVNTMMRSRRTARRSRSIAAERHDSSDRGSCGGRDDHDRQPRARGQRKLVMVMRSWKPRAHGRLRQSPLSKRDGNSGVGGMTPPLKSPRAVQLPKQAELHRKHRGYRSSRQDWLFHVERARPMARKGSPGWGKDADLEARRARSRSTNTVRRD